LIDKATSYVDDKQYTLIHYEPSINRSV